MSEMDSLRPKIDKRRGTITFRIRVKQPGRLTLNGKQLVKIDRQLPKAAIYNIPLKLKTSAMRRLRRKGKVKTDYFLSFTGTGATYTQSEGHTLTFTLKR